MSERPIVLCIGGHDPTGGAGIVADAETVTALGARAVTLVTALTTQNTHNVQGIHPTSNNALSTQFASLIADLPPRAIKIGLVGSPGQAELLARLTSQLDVPLIVDPVLAAGGGFNVGGDALASALREHLVPRCRLLTPNMSEACRLADADDAGAASRQLLDAGADAVLLTATDGTAGEQVENRLYQTEGVQSFHWPRLAFSYHGSGCTLASACAAGLALGETLLDAVDIAQAFTYRALQRADRPGSGQHLPDRRA